MARCKRVPSIETHTVPAAPDTYTLHLGRDTVAFILRMRTPVGMTIGLGDTPVEVFSLGAAETYSEENLGLEDELVLVLSAASEAVVEVWSWAG